MRSRTDDQAGETADSYHPRIAGSIAVPIRLPCRFGSPEQAASERHLLYVATPGIRNYLEFGGAGILVFDMGRDHAFVRRIETPASQLSQPENIKGICASAATGKLYFTTLTKLYCVDLLTDKTLWFKALPGGCDRMAI